MREFRIDCCWGNLLTAINFHDNLRKSCIVYIILRRYTFGRGNVLINPRMTPTFRGALSNLSCLLIAVERTNKFLVNAHECMFIFNRACS